MSFAAGSWDKDFGDGKAAFADIGEEERSVEPRALDGGMGAVARGVPCQRLRFSRIVGRLARHGPHVDEIDAEFRRRFSHRLGPVVKARRIGEEAIIPIVKRRVSGKVERLRIFRVRYSNAKGARWGAKESKGSRFHCCLKNHCRTFSFMPNAAKSEPLARSASAAATSWQKSPQWMTNSALERTARSRMASRRASQPDQSPSRQCRSAKTENMMVSFISVSRSLKRDALAAARERQLIED